MKKTLFTVFDEELNQFKNSLIYQGSATRPQRRNLFNFRVKLPPVTTSLTTQS